MTLDHRRKSCVTKALSEDEQIEKPKIQDSKENWKKKTLEEFEASNTYTSTANTANIKHNPKSVTVNKFTHQSPTNLSFYYLIQYDQCLTTTKL